VSPDHLVEVGTDFRASSLDVLARSRLADDAVPAFLRGLTERGIPEVALVSTCNRFELYAATDTPDEAAAALEEEVRALLDGNGHVEIVARRDRDAVAHLIAVAAGLESALLGEHEVLGQVRRAHIRAADAGAAGHTLARVFGHALRHGRRIRRALGISNVRRSLTELAADWLVSEVEEPPRRSAVVVGAGETASQMAARLRAAGFGRLTIVNRSFERSRELAEAVGASTEAFGRLPAAVREADVLVLATSAPEPVVTAKDMRRALNGRSEPFFLVDLGLSPNAEAGASEHPRIKTLTLSDVIGLALTESRRERTRTIEAGALVQAAADELKPRVASTV
jgi:glutamyl-tRNA reductase